MTEIGKNIRNARVRAGLTQDELAKRASVSRNYITQIETGRKKPAIKMLNGIAKATNSKVSELLEGDEFIEKIMFQMLDRAKEVGMEIGDFLKRGT
jgi:transcriptional regulator with XRE-family HTH domain